MMTVDKWKLPPESTFVAHDELDMAFSKTVIKEGGSAKLRPFVFSSFMQQRLVCLTDDAFFSGHNGLRSMMGCISMTNIQRIKIGIGRPDSRADIVAHVLGRFRVQERVTLDKVILPYLLFQLKTILREKVAPPFPTKP